MKLLFLTIAIYLSVPNQFAIAQQVTPNPKKMLLLDVQTQIEATDAVNNMYNFKFERAERDFRWIQFQHPDHPLPYFLLGLSEWWKIVPNIDNEQYDERCHAYMDTAIALAEKIYDEDEENMEAAFFLAGAYGFKGRLYSERSDWRKAAVAGKNALKYLRRNEGTTVLSPEFLFGDALYNYYVEWIPENYPALKPILFFFSNGDKALGVKQLQKVANNAFYTRTEAQYFLMRIYTEENQNDKAYELSKYVSSTFPDNAYFQRYYARMAYTQGRVYEAETASLSILDKISKKMPGYEATSGRYASFYLGYVYQNIYMDVEKAKKYYEQSVQFSEQTKAFESGYYLASLTALARIADNRQEYDVAKGYYQKVVDNAEKKSASHQEAKKYLSTKKIKRLDKKR